MLWPLDTADSIAGFVVTDRNVEIETRHKYTDLHTHIGLLRSCIWLVRAGHIRRVFAGVHISSNTQISLSWTRQR